MIGRYRLLPAADRDLDEQAGYLADNASLETALRYYDNAAASFATIAGMPGMGEHWESADLRLAGLRVWRIEGFEKHLIFYRHGDDGIDIVRVLHGARDIPSILESAAEE
ncbi:type II toxin-antitoxin system RelE/ParE family toxin [Paludisphaera borealis]|uniref:ParE toxin n=1 Tax=Paludisphaera borealis TaxID=1387353 RepID=A0A1U7CZI5_9BACT|nr:type II toxin-antitoxin system RelE/ParE family toxin [Paludisphaera borealis]APW64303.1 ParE toxin [Paludisphaera borealis]